MPEYEINDLRKEESWRLFRILGEFIEGFEKLAGIEPAVTIYGSARIKPDKPDYESARQIAFLLGKEGFNVVTGGGPGIMEAGNWGAREAGVKSIGLNIKLTPEQACNLYVTESITFSHFYVRKVMLARFATAFIVMPGGIGTMDELTEMLNLIQTQKIKPFPVIIFNSNYWQGLLEWLKKEALGNAYISESDLDLLRVSDDPKEVVEIVKTWYLRQAITGRRAVR